MMRHFALCLALALPAAAAAQEAQQTVETAIDTHILPRYEALAEAGGALQDAAADDCAPDAPALREAYQDAFDAWISASHLRFGPSERNDRAFALAFWPDTRGITPRTLRELIADADPVVKTPEEFAKVSIAARGLYALEYLLFDPDIKALGDTAYRCALTRAITADISGIAESILTDWQNGYADAMRSPGEGSPYRTPEEAVQELFKALAYGLEFTEDTRLGRPLGTFDQPRPTRAEAWRAGRPLRNVILSLEALADLGGILAARDPVLAEDLQAAFAAALSDAEALDDPDFAGVSDPLKRVRIESLQQSIGQVRDIVQDRLGPELGVASGFNALDGD